MENKYVEKIAENLVGFSMFQVGFSKFQVGFSICG